MTEHPYRPQFENAPGISVRWKGDHWEAAWRARGDLVKRGFLPKNQHLWSGTVPTPHEMAEISDTCRRLQDEMLIWGRGGLPEASATFDATVRTLVACYQTDPDSRYHKLRYQVRVNTDGNLKRIVLRHGHETLADIKARVLLVWHDEWSDGGTKLSMGHALIAHLRSLFSFGATILEDPDCERLCGVMHKMRFPNAKPRVERLTAEQVVAFRKSAREHFGWDSMALAQALQFDLMLRQKDVIGEWIPITEPGLSDVTHKKEKWVRGLRWSEINENMILTHNTSKREKDLVVNLSYASMFLEEMELGIVTRSATGPMIISDITGLPWKATEFRRKWRLVADHAGIPKTVKNMDSRSGAISEATDAGIDLEHIRHAATHSDIQMTQRYSRGSAEKVENVQKLRLKHRNKPKT